MNKDQTAIGLSVSLDINFFNLDRIRKLYRQRPFKAWIQLQDLSFLSQVTLSDEIDSFIYEDHFNEEEFNTERPLKWRSIHFFIQTGSFSHQNLNTNQLSPQDLIDKINYAKNCFLDYGFQNDEIQLTQIIESQPSKVYNP